VSGGGALVLPVVPAAAHFLLLLPNLLVCRCVHRLERLCSVLGQKPKAVMAIVKRCPLMLSQASNSNAKHPWCNVAWAVAMHGLLRLNSADERVPTPVLA
jgi:hypothetical protein